ncbi:FAD-dependent oxidoreductase [Clostridium sp. 'deep sea']|uniref:FAD-dependent oxidoreductase n=1 Tax=Clostridium sp. 'deep sea' TaxID=2779445 RepID=UPI001896A342|nr:FAD-dependent oxidoreductase [Clostridium sp. 'deep sea']QOR34021.1 FAD-dependent oxidoreductase [Clostridium sp. 'deep sea']
MHIKKIIMVVLLLLILIGCTKQSTVPPLSESRQQKIPAIHEEYNDNEFSVIVVGSDPEGISAAIAAARAGGKVLLIDKRDKVGGLFTLGWLNFLDMNYNKNKVLVTQGIFKEFYKQIEGIAFSIKTADKVFNNLLSKEKNITLMLNMNDIKPQLKDNKIIGITANNNNEEYTYFCNTLIDATQDGDIAALAGAPFTLGYEDIGGAKFGMAVTQVFSLKGMTNKGWSKLRKHLKNDGDKYSSSTNNTAWGFKNFNKLYKPINKNAELRGPNFAREPDGRIMINALRIFQINPLDPISIESAKQIAKQEIAEIIPFFREQVPGMENIKLDAIAPELYIRESRHFVTEYRLTITDVLENRDQEDRIALGSYPVDMQGTAPKTYALILGNPNQYAIPFRSLVPLNIDNLLIVGRSAGFDSLAHGSARMVPVGMCTGEAAGVAAIIAKNNNVNVRALSKDSTLVKSLQDQLINNGAYLPEFEIKDKFLNHKYYTGISFIRQYALVCGNYNNDYLVDRIINTGEYNWLVQEIVKRRELTLEGEYLPCKTVKDLQKTDINNSFANNPKLLTYLNSLEIYQQTTEDEFISIGKMATLLYHIDEYLNK